MYSDAFELSRGVPGLTLFLHATVPFCGPDATSPVKESLVNESPVKEWLGRGVNVECGMWNVEWKRKWNWEENRNLSYHFPPHSHLASFVMIDNQ